jgi:hypothetical protein
VRCRFLRRQLKRSAYRQSIIAASAHLLRLISTLVKQGRTYRPRKKWDRQPSLLEKAYAQKKAQQTRQQAHRRRVLQAA